MNINTGEILSNSEYMKKINSLDESDKELLRKQFIQMDIKPTEKQLKKILLKLVEMNYVLVVVVKNLRNVI